MYLFFIKAKYYIVNLIFVGLSHKTMQKYDKKIFLKNNKNKFRSLKIKWNFGGLRKNISFGIFCKSFTKVLLFCFVCFYIRLT